MSSEGYWRAPRRLRSLLEQNKLTATEYGLLHYLAESGADRADGTTATYEQLARLQRVTPKTIARAFAKYRALDLLEHDLQQGQRRPFRVTAGAALRVRLRTETPPPMSDDVSEVSSDTVPPGASADTAPRAASPSATTSDKPSKAAAPTETGNKNTAAKLLTSVVDTYCAAGGSLDLAEWRGALVRQANTLARKGVDERTLLAAVARLGRERAFPGYLTQRVGELEQRGGPCAWEGLDRSRLTREQLGECECRACAEWLAFAPAGAP